MRELMDHLKIHHSSGYGQPISPFFGRLPPEIRHQIYEALLHSAGSTQHIYKSDVGDSAAITQTPCLIDPDDDDVRELRYVETFSEISETACRGDPNNYDQKVWRGRQSTDWCNHWQCEEGGSEDPEAPHFGAFLGPLLTCKRMHDEFADVVYSGVTFSFINTPALDRFLATTSPRCLALVRAVHLIWCASTDDEEATPQLTPDGATDTVGGWKSLWSRLALHAPRLNHVRIWIYGRYPRFSMPEAVYFQALDDFADGTFYAAAADRVPRVMDKFTVQTVWTRNFEGFVAFGVEIPEDDGETVPDWLRGRRFEMSRVPAVEYEPHLWMLMYARSEATDTAGRGQGAVPRGRGWGIRGKALRGEDGRAVFLRA